MKTIIATITLVAALTLGVFAAVNPASAQEASEGFSLTGDTNAEVEDSFLSLAESKGWRADWIHNSIVHCQFRERKPCLEDRAKALSQLNSIAHTEPQPIADFASPAVPVSQAFQAVPPCNNDIGDIAAQAVSNCVNQ